MKLVKAREFEREFRFEVCPQNSCPPNPAEEHLATHTPYVWGKERVEAPDGAVSWEAPMAEADMIREIELLEAAKASAPTLVRTLPQEGVTLGDHGS